MYFPLEDKREHVILYANTLALARGVSGDPIKVYRRITASRYSFKLLGG